MISMSRLGAIIRKEIRQLRRDRLTFGMIVGLPILQMLLFGYAINTDVRNLRTAIANEAGTPIQAAGAGRVSWTGEMPIRGNTVIVDHGAGVKTGYHHLRAILG